MYTYMVGIKSTKKVPARADPGFKKREGEMSLGVLEAFQTSMFLKIRVDIKMHSYRHSHFWVLASKIIIVTFCNL